MTAQIGENLFYQGRRTSMCTNPLEQYFILAGKNSPFIGHCTSLWRGYVGSWEIKENRLYLTKLSDPFSEKKEINLEILFPKYPERVYAHWYSGTIRIPEGKMLNYVHMGYGSKYERDLLLTIKKGVVVEGCIRHNGE